MRLTGNGILRVNLNDIAIVVSFLMLKTTFFLNNTICRLLMAALLVYLLKRFYQIQRNVTKKEVILLLLYMILSIISTAFNGGTPWQMLQNMIMLIEMIFIYQIAFQADEERALSTIYLCITLYLILNFVLLIIFPGGLIVDIKETLWLLTSGKFSTGYLCIIWFALTVWKYPKEYAIKFLVVVISMYTLVKIECSTGLAAFAVMVFIHCLPGVIRHRILNYKFMIFSVAIAMYGIVFTQVFLNNALSTYVIRDILGEDLTLTGRVPIYNMIFDYIAQKPWLGWGYNNTVVPDVLGYGNPQNGVLQIVLNAGIPAMIFLGGAFIVTLKRIPPKYEGLSLGIYGMLICSIIEVTFLNTYFYIVLAILFSVKGDSCIRRENNGKKKVRVSAGCKV